ncbi:unnamed protein product [Periconia digitata]|uniref:Uncharacterized protein n=1 Tax=Periconia digitata TaxID=1303443 RepID=A0A9W4XD88_9PLEO|nr:unnamed protein product [Periconia digitata]
MLLLTTLSLLALSHITTAQDANSNNNDNDLYHLFGSVVFIRSGERTPTSLYTPGPQSLTPLGAQQMHALGANFRSRYISPSTGSPRTFGVQKIQDISPDVLVQDQLSIQTLEKPYLVASAQAFMQGLYPPHSNPNQAPDSSYTLGNGSTVDFPLGGYQYPNVQVLGSLDPRSIYLDGLTNCSVAKRANLMYQLEEEYLRTRSAEKAFYANLSSMTWASAGMGEDEEDEQVKEARIDYRYATQVYENLSYALNHDQETYESLSKAAGTQDDVVTRARILADKMAYYTFANTTSSTSDDDHQAVAGKTLAALILGQLQRIVDKHTLSASEVAGVNAPELTLLFGDSEPMTSFFDLAMVQNSSDKFKAAPTYGSAMVFELFTLRRDPAFPTKDNLSDLRVRFYFHNATSTSSSTSSSSTNSTESLTSYSLFNDPSPDTPWPTYQDMVQRIMLNHASSWCQLCDSPALFCAGFDGSSSAFDQFPKSTDTLLNGKWSTSKVSPAVAGVIGAVVALVVAALVFAAGMVFAGVRVQRHPSSSSHHARSFHSPPFFFFGRRGQGRFDRKYGGDTKSPFPFGGAGGFKGAAKLASDPDLSLHGNAVPPAGAGMGAAVLKGHERVGSWELRQKEVGREIRMDDESPRASFDGIDEAVGGGGRRVEPVERI